MAKATKSEKSSKNVKLDLAKFNPADLTAIPVTGWAAFIDPATKQGAVRVIMGPNQQELTGLADTTIATIVTILQSGNCFFDGTNVITRHM